MEVKKRNPAEMRHRQVIAHPQEVSGTIGQGRQSDLLVAEPEPHLLAHAEGDETVAAHRNRLDPPLRMVSQPLDLPLRRHSAETAIVRPRDKTIPQGRQTEYRAHRSGIHDPNLLPLPDRALLLPHQPNRAIAQGKANQGRLAGPDRG